MVEGVEEGEEEEDTEGTGMIGTTEEEEVAEGDSDLLDAATADPDHLLGGEKGTGRDPAHLHADAATPPRAADPAVLPAAETGTRDKLVLNWVN